MHLRKQAIFQRYTFLLFSSLHLVKGRLLTDAYLARKNVYISAGSRKKNRSNVALIKFNTPIFFIYFVIILGTE